MLVVSVVISVQDVDKLDKQLVQVEVESGKGKNKWNKSKYESRIKYIEKIIGLKKNQFWLYFSEYQTKDLDLATIHTISKAVLSKNSNKTKKVLVYIDALAKSKRQTYAKELRMLGLKIKKIRGVTKDENDPKIRLADTVTGWVRDVLENKRAEKLIKLYKKAKREKILYEV